MLFSGCSGNPINLHSLFFSYGEGYLIETRRRKITILKKRALQEFGEL
jgi:hypothetical protein